MRLLRAHFGFLVCFVSVALGGRHESRLHAQNPKDERKLTSVSVLEGTYQPHFLDLKARFTFATDQEKSIIFLGLKGAHPEGEPQLDQGVGELIVEEDGNFSIQVHRAGKQTQIHHLTLNLEVPVKTKENLGLGPERNFDLGLPRSASTQFTLKLPAEVTELKWNDVVEKQNAGKGKWELKWLTGKADVKVQWKEAGISPAGGALILAETDLGVRLEKNQVEFNAKFTLEVFQGQVKEWQLLLPPQTKMVGNLPGDWDWIAPSDGKGQTYYVRNKKGSSEKLVVPVRVVIPRPPGSSRIPVGPFMVVGVPRSEGSILIQSPVDFMQGQRIFYHLSGDLIQRDPPRAGGNFENLALFQFAGNPFAKKGLANKTFLEIELKPERTLVETNVLHDLKFHQDEEQSFFELETHIFTKSAPGLDYLEVQVPPGLKLNGSSEGETKSAESSQRLKLALSKSKKEEWEARLHGRFVVPMGTTRMHLDLPRPVGSWDRQCTVNVTMPADLELVTGPKGLEIPLGEKQTLTFEPSPASVDLAWRDYKPDLTAVSKVQVDIKSESAYVKQTIFVAKPAKGSRTILSANGKLILDVPAGLLNVKLLKSGQILTEGKKHSAGPFTDASGAVEFQVEYDIPLPKREEGKPLVLPLPLLWPDGITMKEAHVSVFTEAGMFPRVLRQKPGDEVWQNRPARDELTPQGVMPSIILTGISKDLSLTLEVDKPEGSKPPAILCDRTLVQVHVDEEGNQNYRVRFWVRKFSTPQLDMDVPGPPAQATFLVNKDIVTNYKEIPTLYAKKGPLVMEVRYKIPLSSVDAKRFWQTTFHPPVFHQEVFFGKVRWLVGLNELEVPFLLGSTEVDYRWGLPRWLMGPVPAPLSQYEVDLLNDEDLVDLKHVSFIFTRSQLDQQRLYHVNWQTWFLTCSGSILILGIALMLLGDSRFWFWVLLLAVVGGLLTLAWTSPYFLRVFFWGSQLGIAVFAVIGLVQWMLQERYRRQLIFLPGFSRTQPGSTLTRAFKKPREASTIDAPLPQDPGSSRGHVSSS